MTIFFVVIYMLGCLATFAIGAIRWMMTRDLKDPAMDKINITCFLYFWAWPILAITTLHKTIKNMKQRLEDNNN